LNDRADIVVVGAGAAGLMAGVVAARAAPAARVVILDGARKLGAKILVSGGGRCNVTHERVGADDFNGSTRPAIRKVLARLSVRDTLAFFAELGVVVKKEPSGKLFPVTDDARTVLDALLAAARDAGARLAHPRRVTRIEHGGGWFRVCGDWGSLRSRRVIVATGGRSLPKTGSDGAGYGIMSELGHTLTPRVFPALVPLLLPARHPLLALSGTSADVTLEVRTSGQKAVASMSGSLLCTHFGLSGPVVLDISRHWIDARSDDVGASLVCDWLPSLASDDLDARLREGGAGSVAARLRGTLPERLARCLVEQAGIDPQLAAARLARDARRRLVAALKQARLAVIGDRGWRYAEVTAGGVPLAELRLDTLESRACPGLHLCGEICDVDGRIGGFNFQWAWASGYVAGTGAARARSTATQQTAEADDS
jgi:hypothetical protein